MRLVGTTIFADPEDYKDSFRGAKIELVFTGRGDFNARLTSVELPNLHLLRSQESLPRIAYISLAPRRVFISFAAHFDASPICGGVELQPGDMIFHSVSERMHQRTNGPCDWVFISLEPTYLTKFGKVFTGADLAPPSATRILRPRAIAAANLRRLIAKACGVAQSKPNIIAHRECVRSLEQDLFHSLIDCLTEDDLYHHAASTRHHAGIMARFEKVLAAHPDRQLQMDELCKAVGTSQRTLRICCAEVLGLGPSQYGRLRRLNLVRAALARRDVTRPAIAETAARHGFTEPGRFAVVYRSVFGESPTTTLRRSNFIAQCTSAEFAWLT